MSEKLKRSFLHLEERRKTKQILMTINHRRFHIVTRYRLLNSRAAENIAAHLLNHFAAAAAAAWV